MGVGLAVAANPPKFKHPKSIPTQIPIGPSPGVEVCLEGVTPTGGGAGWVPVGSSEGLTGWVGQARVGSGLREWDLAAVIV